MPEEVVQEVEEQVEETPTLEETVGQQLDAATEEPTEEVTETPPVEEEPIDPPVHWSAEHQEMFRGLERNAQSFLMDRSKAMEAAHTQRSQEIAPFRQAVEAWQPYLEQTGADPARTFDTLMGLEYSMRTGTNEQKIQILQTLARDYGVDLGEPESQYNDENDPFGVNRQIEAAVAPLQQQVQQLGGGLQNSHAAQQQAWEQQRYTGAVSKIEEFKSEKGADGKPAHPYFDEVEQDMALLAQQQMAAGQTPDIAQLYESATWSNPSVRAKLRAAEKAQLHAEQARVKRARSAAGGLESGGGGNAQPNSVEEAVGAAWDQVAAT